jgi:alkylation response protein AidB-like acyl-CoA dehydrogenase
MNFEFSEEQALLRDQAAQFLAKECPPAAGRRILDAKEDFDRGLWAKLGQLGWMGTAVPAEFGGQGYSYLELCVLAEELGRAVAPVPFSSSVYLATEALLLAGSPQQKARWLPRLAAGSAIGTLAFAEGAGAMSPRTIRASVHDGRLSGEKVPVPDGAVADLAVVVARDERGDIGLFLVDLDQPGVGRAPLATIDPTRAHTRLAFADAEAETLASGANGWGVLQRILDRAAILFAWEQVGGAAAALSMARDYALRRYAFGRPIGSYQAIKHKLAIAYVKNTLARSNCYYGAWALHADAPDIPIAAASARVSATQAYYHASKENIQTHGGMGFTWESDCQLYYRRAKLLSVNLGSEATWQERLIRAIEHSDAA